MKNIRFIFISLLMSTPALAHFEFLFPVSEILGAYALPSAGSLGDVKFVTYFAAGFEYPCTVAPVLGVLGTLGADPIAVSTAFSLANRCVAVTGFNESMGMHKAQAFFTVAGVDILAGHFVPMLAPLQHNKWIGAFANGLENTFGPIPAGFIMALGSIGPWSTQTLDGKEAKLGSETAEESGMRIVPTIASEEMPCNSTISALLHGSLGLMGLHIAHTLQSQKPWISRWMATFGGAFVMNVLFYLQTQARENL